VVVRVLTGLGALLFAYLALIPIGLIGSLLDSSCAGAGCERELAIQIPLGLLYAACLLAVLGTAVALATHAATGSLPAQRRIGGALAVTTGVVSVTLFALFALAFPLGAAICAGVATLTLTVLWLVNREPRGPRAGPNGHRPDGPAPGELDRVECP
jgi:hypothetical protein